MPDEKELEQTALSWPAKAQTIAITNQVSYDDAAEFIVRIVGLRKQVIEHHAPVKTATYKAHKEAVAAEKKLLDPLRQAETIINRAISEWDAKQELIRMEEQRKLEAAQRKADDDARLALAQEAEENGATEETVDEILETPVVVPAIVAAPTYQKSSNISNTIKRWRAEVVDIKALCRAIGDGKAPSNLVLPNMTALNGLARALKESFNTPGCKAVTDSSVSVRA